jgi:hypothetical protein
MVVWEGTGLMLREAHSEVCQGKVQEEGRLEAPPVKQVNLALTESPTATLICSRY